MRHVGSALAIAWPEGWSGVGIIRGTGLQRAGGISDRLACSTGQPIANPYDRMNPSISDSAQLIAASIDLPDWVHMAIILGIVACANIWVPIFSGAG